MQAETAQVLSVRRLGRPSEEDGEVLHTPDVVFLRLFSEMTGVHVLDHALTKRADRHAQLLLK